jgi:catechol 2,3-dioxygenase-like lactoylglutathione lyase family enzyme
MFENTKAYSGIAVRDLHEARRFYGETLGLRMSQEHGVMWLHLAGGRDTLVYPAARRHPGELQSSTSSRRARRAPGSALLLARTRPHA